jgi:hypothetical protein
MLAFSERNWSYVAINSELVKTALKKIQNDKLKGKTFRVRAGAEFLFFTAVNF